MDLISTENFVESPFIIATFGDYTFGSYTGSAEKATLSRTMRVTYPNMMKSLEVTKINGQVNTYTLKMKYAITQNDDANMLEKVFSSIKNNREMTLTYGDWNNPTSIYREETALITSIKSNMSMSSSAIEYTISGVSNCLTLNSTIYDFPARTAKASEVINEMLDTPSYGLLDTFTGMTDKTKVNNNNLIPTDDKEVELQAKSMGAFDYVNYLVSNMSSVSDPTSNEVKNSVYQLFIVDDSSNNLGGPYFQIKNVTANTPTGIQSSEAGWEVDVGYPGKNFVTGFEIENDETWSILYDYQEKVNQSQYVYRIGNDGSLLVEESPSLLRSKSTNKVTGTSKTWWTQMTQFPIKAKLTIKGLIRPTILMDYLKLNVVFYGQKHISSGIYVITKQVDSISSAGYRTTLSLLRVDGDTL